MPKKASDDLSREGEPTQETAEGLSIPIPEREDFFRDLGKVAPKAEPEEPARSGSKRRRTRREE